MNDVLSNLDFGYVGNSGPHFFISRGMLHSGEGFRKSPVLGSMEDIIWMGPVRRQGDPARKLAPSHGGDDEAGTDQRDRDGKAGLGD